MERRQREQEKEQLNIAITSFEGISEALRKELMTYVLPLVDECFVMCYVLREGETFQLYFEFVEELTGRSAVLKTHDKDTLVYLQPTLLNNEHQRCMIPVPKRIQPKDIHRLLEREIPLVDKEVKELLENLQADGQQLNKLREVMEDNDLEPTDFPIYVEKRKEYYQHVFDGFFEDKEQAEKLDKEWLREFVKKHDIDDHLNKLKIDEIKDVDRQRTFISPDGQEHVGRRLFQDSPLRLLETTLPKGIKWKECPVTKDIDIMTTGWGCKTDGDGMDLIQKHTEYISDILTASFEMFGLGLIVMQDVVNTMRYYKAENELTIRRFTQYNLPQDSRDLITHWYQNEVIDENLYRELQAKIGD